MPSFISWTWVPLIALVTGLALIFFGKKKLHQPAYLNIVQWGYLFFLVSFFGFLCLFVDFTVGMFCLTLMTGLCWLIEKFFLSTHQSVQKYPTLKHFVNYSQGFFIVSLSVFCFRSFVAEPFRIPSSSMRPSLIPGDFILVNKFSYGLRLPILDHVVVPLDEVKRGDVVVFNSPPNPKINFIKRVIGLPGDRLIYQNKVLFINGRALTKIAAGHYIYPDDENHTLQYNHQFIEKINHKSIKTLNDPQAPSFYINAISYHRHINQCRYQKNGSAFMCLVPPGHYFVMGDNRDSSNDSRYWGFVNADRLVGKAFMIWMNFGDMSRVGQMIN